jgi:AbrB family looped-hinge helix DNA binding protein
MVIAMTLTLDKFCRLVVPKALREQFGLGPGAELEVRVEGAGICLRPRQPAASLVEQNGILVCAGELPVAAWDVGAFLEEQRAQRSRDLGGL